MPSPCKLLLKITVSPSLLPPAHASNKKERLGLSMPLKRPKYAKGYWTAAFKSGYVKFCQDIDYMNKPRVITRQEMEQAWNDTMEELVYEWDGDKFSVAEQNDLFEKAKLSACANKFPTSCCASQLTSCRCLGRMLRSIGRRKRRRQETNL